jgi:hypothetical protein
VIPFKDAGKACADKTDCVGLCLMEVVDDWRNHPPGSAAAGRCQREDNRFGCFFEVQEGKIAGSWCAD